MRFKDKVAVITGATAGIGHAAALAFAREGAKLALIGSSEVKEGCYKELDDTNAEYITLKVDVSNEEAIRQAIEEIYSRFNNIDILVNCAGIVIPGSLETSTAEQMDLTLAVNVKGLFLMSKYTVEKMCKARGGVVVNISSSVAIKGVKDRITYTASKGAVLSMTRAMAAEYMQDNIRFNCICPGTTHTPSLNGRIAAFDDAKQAMKDFIDRQPMKRLGMPEEIAESILFASDDKVTFLNGAVISIDGGMTV